MQKLTEALQGVIEQGSGEVLESEEFEGNPEAAALQKAAGEWARASVNTFSGDLLDRALDVSKSLSRFTMELATPGSTKEGASTPPLTVPSGGNGGWAFNPKFLDEITTAVSDMEGDWSVSMEQVDCVLQALKCHGYISVTSEE